MTTAITATVGVICLVLAFLMWWKIPDFMFGPVLQIGLIITGSIGIANTFAGQWIRGAITWISNGISSLFGRFVGVAVPWLIALICATVVVCALIEMFKSKDARIDDASGHVAVSAFVLPLAAATLPGVVGSAVQGGLVAVSNGVGSLVMAAFGMR